LTAEEMKAKLIHDEEVLIEEEESFEELKLIVAEF